MQSNLFHQVFKSFSLVTTLSIGLFNSFSFANEIQLSNQEIVNKAAIAAYYGGNDGRTMARMTITDANSREQIRQFTIIRKDMQDGGEQKFLIVFSRPSDVKDTVFMVHKKVSGEDDRWLYLPALDLVKRISSGDKRTSFVGTHYFYEDVSGRSPQEDNHQLLEENERFYIMQHTPKNPETVEFASYMTWIDKQNFLPVKIVYLDAQGKKYRQIEALSIADIETIPTVTKAKITDLRDGSNTILEFRNMTYNLGIPDTIFSERSLRNPPVEWLKSN